MGKFKGKRKINNIIIYIGLFIMSIAFSIKYLYSHDLIKSNTIVDYLISDNLGTYNKDISDVDFLLKYILNIDFSNEKEVINNENNEIKLEVGEQVNNVLEPLVYIYNTHQEEKYQSAYLEPYNISSSVFIASKILKEYLEDLGIGVIVEEKSITDKLHSLNLKYGSSYEVSRMFMEEAIVKNSSLTYFIDLHRDSSKYDKTTIDIDGEKYARLLFVIGLDNSKYESNLAMAEKLRTKIDNYNANLCRGIMKKSGKGVNGVYNQDFNSNTILIEVGGQYNNIREVNNTLKVLANILAEYIKEDMDG